MRNPQKDLEALELLRSKDWFKSNKGNMDLAEMCEYYINEALRLENQLNDKVDIIDTCFNIINDLNKKVECLETALNFKKR